jgi:hypothetical protein
MDVRRFGAHCGLSSDIARGPKRGQMPTLGAGVSGGAKYPHIADEHRAVEARQAITPNTSKTETMTFNYFCFAG